MWYKLYKFGWTAESKRAAMHYQIVLYDIGKYGETTYLMGLN